VKQISKGKIRKQKTFILNDERYKDNIWEMAIAQNKTKHPAVFPDKLAHDHIISWTNENDLVFDCMGGRGTTPKMARILKRNWIMSEISSEYCEIAEEYIYTNFKG
jgi:site-specific DNA-methyltransferase (adenine-specific)